MKKILIATDAFFPQINGVYRTLYSISKELEKEYEIFFLEPSLFKKIKNPMFYKDLQISYNLNITKKIIKKENPDYIHIATEGPIGLSTKIYCDRKKIPYTTSYHTMFPEYLCKFGIPKFITYSYLRWFHKKSKKTLTTTESMVELLKSKNFKHVISWTRGIDRSIFKPYDQDILATYKKPIYSYIGRVSKEKNLDAFLSLNLEGTKIIVGNGDYLDKLKEKYKDVLYIDFKHGEELGKYFSSTDVFVFPSKTDTFGLVIIEAMATGTPVVAFDVQGPKDIIIDGINGFLCKNENEFKKLIELANNLNREKCIISVEDYTWDNCCEIFKDNLIEIN